MPVGRGRGGGRRYLAVVAEPPPARYLSPTGSNANDGLTTSTPWQTFQHAVQTAPASAEVFLLAGNYPNFAWANYTARTGVVTFKPQAGVVPLVEGFTVPTTGPLRVDRVAFDGLRFVVGTGLRGTDLTFRNCTWEFDPAAPVSHACTIQDGSTDVTVEDNTFVGNLTQFAIFLSSDSVAQGGSSTEPTIDDVFIRRNTMDGMRHGGLNIRNFVRCTVEDNIVRNITRVQGDGTHTDAIRTFRGGTDLIVRRNFIDNNDAIGFFIKDGTVTRAEVTDNVIIRCLGSWQEFIVYDVDGYDLVNNTTDGTINFGAPTDLANVTDARIFNNICTSMTKDGTVTELYRNHNAVQTYSGFTAASNDVSTVPTFVDSANQNYRLASGSSAQNAGVASGGGFTAPATDADKNTRPFGAAPDIGAYERQEA